MAKTRSRIARRIAAAVTCIAANDDDDHRTKGPPFAWLSSDGGVWVTVERYVYPSQIATELRESRRVAQKTT